METGPLWYAARAKPSQERVALDNLKRQNFQAYYPLIQFEKAKNGKVVRTTEGLFPGYLFVNCFLEPAAWRLINSTRGILKLLSFSQDGKPAPVPNGEIEKLQLQEKSGEFVISEIVVFKKGDFIKIKNGPSAGRVGQVIRTRGERVEFLLQLLGRHVRCIAPQHTLDLVERERKSSCAVAIY